jgi:hypothetical protein
MRIKKIDIPKTPDDNDGLESIKMDKLGSVVLIAGKNGSGKTRILNKIFDRFSSKPKKSSLVQSRISKQSHLTAITHYQRSISELEAELITKTDTNRREEIQQVIENQKYSLTKKENNLRINEDEQNWKYIETDIQSDDYNFVRFVPKSLDLQDCNAFTKSQLLGYATSIDSVGIDNLPGGAFARIQVIQDRWFNATHQYAEVTNEEKEQATADYNKLQDTVKILLDTRITRTTNGDWLPLDKINQ